MHPFLLDLMRKFELCFPFTEGDERYLVPELLGKQQPLEATGFGGGDCLRFQYHYPVLPEGLLPRFIVRTNVLSGHLPRWKTGVILQFEDNQALVKADIQEQKVLIAVNGPVAGRRRLLAVVRSDLERIHADVKKLDAHAVVPLPDDPRVVIPYDELVTLERDGISKLPRVLRGRTVHVNVSELLNGVDMDGARTGRSAEEHIPTGLRVFFSYSHKDEDMRNELETQLKLLQRLRLISTWSDRRIQPGDEWRTCIDEQLQSSDLMLLLVSSDFLASDYCMDVEMKLALEKQQKGEMKIVAVILRDCGWRDAPFAKFQVLPAEGRPVSLWENRDSAWRNVYEGMKRLAEDARTSGKKTKAGVA